MKARLYAAVMLGALVLAAGCGGGPKPAPVEAQPTAAASIPAAASGAGSTYVIVADQSEASYHVTEKFLNRDLPSDVVGSTRSIKGELVLEGGVLKPSTVTVDLRSLKSDSGRRDGALQNRGLETARYPEAVFVISGAAGGVKLPTDGSEVSLRLEGALKIHGTERPTTWDGRASLKGDVLSLTATAGFKMGDFNIDPPDVAGMLKVNDDVRLEVKVTAQKR